MAQWPTRLSSKQEVPGSNPTVGKNSFFNSRLFRVPHRTTMQLRMKSTVAYTKLIPCFSWIIICTFERTRQIIRYITTANLRRLKIKQYTASNEGGGYTKPMGTSKNFDKVCSGAPDSCFGKLLLIRNAKIFDNSQNSYCIYFKLIYTGKFTHIISKRTKLHISKIDYIPIHSVLISKIDNISIHSVLLWQISTRLTRMGNHRMQC